MAQEVEAKFYIRRIAGLRHRLETLGAQIKEARVKESNIRFDTPGRDLRRMGLVLRLRQDSRARLTYKGADESDGSGALNRREVEFTVSDFDEARELFEALGYEIALTYEKFRTTYELDDTEIMLDEMPYGNFVEIEGDSKQLRPVAEKLGLQWDAAIRESYSRLFDRLKEKRQLEFRDLTFENFKDLTVTPEELGVQPADA